jgi:hypothetical protein
LGYPILVSGEGFARKIGHQVAILVYDGGIAHHHARIGPENRGSVFRRCFLLTSDGHGGQTQPGDAGAQNPLIGGCRVV